MKQEIKEKLSALMDDELPRHELAAVLDRLNSDPEYKALWDRYHLIGDAVRGEVMRLNAQGINERVSAAIAEEPTVLSPGAASQPHWVKPAIGSAIAASVAVLAILAAPRFITTEENNISSPMSPMVAEQPVASQALSEPQAPVIPPAMLKSARQAEVMPATVVEQVSPTAEIVDVEVVVQTVPTVPKERLYEQRSGTRWDGAEPAVENKLNSYLVNHKEHAPPTNITGMLPYATFVGYDSRK